MTLHEIGLKHGADKATFHKYLDFYEKHLPKRTFKGRLLEIGVMDGASLEMWSEYYPNAEIIGIDIDDKSHLKITHWKCIQMDGTDPEQLKTLGKFDVIIDDGSHYTKDQQASFKHLYYNQLKKNGVYILEDTHTSLMPRYVNSKLTTLEFLDKLGIEVLHWRRDPKIDDSMTAIIKGGQ